MKQIPVYVISGLLESGKTTFIKDTIASDDFFTKGKTLVLSGEEGEVEYEEAKEDYTLAIEKGFDDAIVYASRGVANMHSENIQEANMDFKKALELGFNETDENAFITVEDINYFLE